MRIHSWAATASPIQCRSWFVIIKWLIWLVVTRCQSFHVGLIRSYQLTGQAAWILTSCDAITKLWQKGLRPDSKHTCWCCFWTFGELSLQKLSRHTQPAKILQWQWKCCSPLSRLSKPYIYAQRTQTGDTSCSHTSLLYITYSTIRCDFCCCKNCCKSAKLFLMIINSAAYSNQSNIWIWLLTGH